MVDIPLSDAERKVLSYTARGVASGQAVDKISAFLGMPPNVVLGTLNSLRKQNLVVESKSGTATLSVLTNNPLKVRASMLDSSITTALTNKEHGVKAGSLKKASYSQDMHTGEIRDANAPVRNTSAQTKKPGIDLGFELD